MERIAIRFFFKEFFLQENLGHVLFFETKPAALKSFCLKKTEPLFDHFFTNIVSSIHDKYLKYGWKAWKKYEYLFPNSNFIFAEDETIMSNGDHIAKISIFKKKTLLQCLHAHQLIFQETLGPSFSPDCFLKELSEKRKILPLINHDEMLLGILLGFGKESSLAFKNQSLGIMQKKYSGIEIPLPKNCPIWPISFMGNPNSHEVQNLVKVYEKELKELNIKYQNSKDFLSLLLTQIVTSN